MMNAKVLVVDGDYSYTAVLEPFLEQRGYEVDVAVSAADALAKIRREKQMGRAYSAVLTRLFIPVGEDKDICRREREDCESVRLGGLDLLDAIIRRSSILPVIALARDEIEERYAFRHRATKVVKKSDFGEIEKAIKECMPYSASAIR